MSEADSEQRRNLECLRLASDFMQMSRDALNPAGTLRPDGELLVRAGEQRSDEEPCNSGRSVSAMIDKASRASGAVVLIVEDEPLLRQLAAEVVEDAGFVALEAADAGEAVALLETRSDIAVLFTDINMPGSMDGLKLAHAVRDRWPPIKIIVASGHVRLQVSDLPSNSTFLLKPYRGAAVVAQLRSLVSPS